jgi:transposase-like protein
MRTTKTKQRRNFSADFKARVAVEGIKGQRTIQEIGAHYGVHPNQVTKWKRQALDVLPQVFADHRTQGNQTDEALISELYQQIGKLKVQLDWLKKRSGLSE